LIYVESKEEKDVGCFSFLLFCFDEINKEKKKLKKRKEKKEKKGEKQQKKKRKR